MRDPILIVGTARSGTSMTAGCLHACGAWMGPTVPGGPPNPKGFFENGQLREHLIKPTLQRLGADPLGVRSFPESELVRQRPVQIVQVVRKQAEETIKHQGYDDSVPWAWKTIKAVPMWQIWDSAFPWAHWVVCIRPIEQIIASCLRTGFMNQHSHEHGFWEVWATRYRSHLGEIMRELPKKRVHVVETDKLAGGDCTQIEKAVLACGLDFDEAEVREFVDPALWSGAA